jgi:hypothetical protein
MGGCSLHFTFENVEQLLRPVLDEAGRQNLIQELAELDATPRSQTAAVGFPGARRGKQHPRAAGVPGGARQAGEPTERVGLAH